MSVEKLNHWLTLGANLAVFAGIVFLGIEIQQSRVATEAATYQARSTEIQEAGQNYALSDYLPEIYDKLEMEGIESLDTVQLRRLAAWEGARINRMASQIQQSNLGFLDDNTVSGMLELAASLIPLWESLGLNINQQLLGAINSRP